MPEQSSLQNRIRFLAKARPVFPFPTGPAVLLLVLALAAGCASPPVPVRSGVPSDAPTPAALASSVPAAEHPAVPRLNRLIFTASPASLGEAWQIVGEIPDGGPRIQELRFLIRSLAEILYPEWALPGWSGREPEPPAGSPFPGILGEIRRGRYPRVAQQDASNLSLLFAPLSILFSAGPPDAALAGLNQVEALSGLSVMPPYLRGVIAERRGGTDAAISRYEEALRRDRSCYPAAVAKARLIMAGRPGEAVDLLEASLLVVPRSARVLALLAEGTARIGRREESARYLEQSLGIDPQQPGLLLLRARLLADEGRWREALLLMQAADAKTPPGHEKALLKAQILFHGTGDVRGALRALEPYAAECSGNPECAVLLGRLLLVSGERERGRAVLESLLDSGKPDPGALLLLLDDAVQQESYSRAQRFLEPLLDAAAPGEIGTPADGGGDPALPDLAYRTYAGLELFPKALPFAEDLYRANPDPKHAAWYARTLVAAGRRREAADVIVRGLAEDASREVRSDLLFLRSRVRSDPASSEQDLIASLFEHPANIETLLALADRSMHDGEYTRAYLYLRQAEAADPKNRIVQERLERAESVRNSRGRAPSSSRPVPSPGIP